ncbi:MAG: hypothetical protein OXU66_07615 [Gammaproteobacteria bacterium]|nr:hypothetical protein [Gammaproteobacteria bacterium]MDD9895860.1 hypothetical protein [Gammaproteobacteria bacterium]MDD9958793.1 hypothetical protein [Gammaproteobacteria bacterium]
MVIYRIAISCLITVSLIACSSAPPPESAPPPIPKVGNVDLDSAIIDPEEHLLLDIGVKVFDIEIGSDEALEFGEWIFTEIRENETHYLPYVLRNTLLTSNQWGPVRVLPTDDPSMDLTVSGTVLFSDGLQLAMRVIVLDSTGKVWFENDYADQSQFEDYPESTRYTPGNPFDSTAFIEPFQDIYNQINNDLVQYRNGLTREELTNIKRISQLVYARDLSPESFSENLSEDENGFLTITSLPADGDPQFSRVQDMRLRHHVFIDTVDNYYASLYEEMQAPYVVWRKYSYDQIEEESIAESRAYDFSNYGRSRGFLTLAQRYDRYRWSKIFEMEYRDLSVGFNNEIAPAILELNEQVHGLSGTMEEQYIQWRRILRQLFALEEEALD